MADWNDPAVWARAYVGLNGATYLDGRSWANKGSWGGDSLVAYRHKLQRLGAIPNFTPATDVLLVGCGLGWLLEAITDLGSNNAWGTDISTLIHDRLDNDPDIGVLPEIRNRILNIDVSLSDARQLFRSAGAGDNRGTFDWVLTEHTVEDMDLANAGTFMSGLDNLRSNQPGGVAHLVIAADMPLVMDPEFMVNQMTLDEWQAWALGNGWDHWWIDTVTGDMRGPA